MARFGSNMTRIRSQLKGGGLFLIVAVVVFAGIVFLLFRDRSGGPREAAAEGRRSTEPTAQETPSPAGAVETAERPQSTAAEPSPEPLPPETATTEPPVEVHTPVNAQAQVAIAEVQTLLRTQPSAVIEARDKLSEILDMPLTAPQRKTVRETMAELSEDWLFGPAAFAGDRLCDTYRVKRGDLLQIIGRRFKVPYEALMRINRVPRPEALQAGMGLKVVNGPFHAKVYRSTFTLDLYLQGTYVRSFKVGLGKPGHETPTGLWRVKEGGKLVKPTWTDPDTGRVYKGSDPNYPLGSRWIALDGVDGAARGRTGFAIHGTKDPEQIGTAGSRGCIRMYNGDAILVYDLLEPLYSQVEVFD